MIVVPIFADPDPDKGGLYAVQYRENEDNCLSQLLKRLGTYPQMGESPDNSEWLSKQVRKLRTELRGYPLYFQTDIEAIEHIQKEAADLQKALFKFSRSRPDSNQHSLSNVFRPLDPDRKHRIVESVYNDQAFKSRTPRYQHCLIRLYALQIDGHPNLFLVVGGGLKATAYAQHSPLLGQELHNINLVARALEDAGVTKEWFNNTTPGFRL